ncbi:MAG: hypothetical protein EKK49_01845, partial [Rhodocyclaceae bacterium]
MSLFKFQSEDGRLHEVAVEYDDKRGGWWLAGLGFDFFAHACFDCFEANVKREGSDLELNIRISLAESGTNVTEDVFASKCLKELGRYW